MQLGMIGTGKMGGSMVRRLLRRGHACVVHDRDRAAMAELESAGAAAALSLPQLVAALAPPRAIWLMLPVAAVDGVLSQLQRLLAAGDMVIDGGNSHYRDDLRRAAELARQGIDYVDVGVSGGIAGLERGYCLMAGGAAEAVARLTPILIALAPGEAAAPALPVPEGRAGATPAAHSSATQGYLHCGGPGAGHFVKMAHNGIEYGLMAAYAEGFNLLRHANAGAAMPPGVDGHGEAETSAGGYDFDLAAIAELWRRGSVISSWLLDLATIALREDAGLASYIGHVADSGEGRWTVAAGLDLAVPLPVLSAALFQRFASRGEDDFANRLLSALRHQFGGHGEPSGPDGSRDGP